LQFSHIVKLILNEYESWQCVVITKVTEIQIKKDVNRIFLLNPAVGISNINAKSYPSKAKK